MKQRILFLLLLLLSTWQAWAQVPRTESFETDGNGVAGRYTSNTFNAGNNNYSFRSTYVQGSAPAGYNTTSSRLFNIDGSYFWASEGVNNAVTPTPLNGTPAFVQLTPTTITGFANLKVTVLLADPQGAGSNGGLLRWEADDFIRVKARIDGGTWVTIGQFVGDLTDAGGVAGYLRRDIDIDGVSTNDPASGNAPDGTRAGQLTATLQPFTFNVTGGGTTMDVMVEIAQVGNSEEFAFDKIQITGTASTNALPQLQNIEPAALAYNEGGPAIQITNTLTVTDADNATLSSGTVRISTNFNASEDVLSFTGDGTTGNIVAGTYNTTNGTLPLTSAGSTATLAQWQSALRKVTYRNSDAADASPLTRTVSFTVTDPAGGTNVATTRDITVTTSLDAAAAPPYTEDFTTDGEGTRYATNRFAPTANNTTFQRTNVTPYPNNPSGVTFTNISNGFYFYGSGVSNQASPNNPKPVFIQTRKVDAVGYVNLKYQVRLGASSQWYKDSYVKLYYRTGTNAWVIFGSFRATDQTTSGAATPLRQDADPNNLSSAPTGTALTTALQTITFNLPTALNGQQVDFRLEANGPTLVEELAVDLIQVTATQAVAPTVATGTAGSITTTTAAINNNSLTSDGGASLTDYGVVYVAGTGTPTTANSKVQAGTTSPGAFPASFSTSLTGLTPGTQYTARAYATNSVGTSYGSNVTFTTLAPVSGTTVVTNVSCNGGSNGTINLTPSGGVAPYTFLWSPGGQTTEDRTGLAAGTYTVTITDATGATGTVSATITQPSALASATSQTNIACNGGTSGAASVSPSGGTSPYTYRWSTGATTQAVTGLAAGSYSVVITDANGCTRTYSFNITQPSALTATTSQTNVTTNGGTNGSATITVGGGTPSYTYSWSPNVSTTATASNLSAGTYSVTATDANGCTIARSFTITQPTTATVTSVTRLLLSPTALTSVTYQVVFSNSVSGVLTSNFTPTITSGTISGASVSSVSGSGTTYRVTVNTGTGDGTLRLDVANSTGITPTVSNVPYTTGEVYTITKSFAAAPQLTIVGTGGTGSDVTAFVDVVQVLSGGTAFANGLQNGSFEQHDPLSNGDFGYTPTGASWTFNNRSGIAESGSAFTPTTPIPNGIAVAFVQSTNGINGQLQQNLAVPTGTSYQVSFQAAQRVCCTTLDQALNVFLNGVFLGTIQPNSNGYTTFTSATFAVTAPALTASISSTAGASGSTTATSPLPFTVTFSQSVTGFVASDVVVTGGTLTGFSGSGTTYTFNVTPAASGTVTVNVPANGAVDANNTGNTAATQYSITYAQPVTAAPVVIVPANGSLVSTTTPTYAGTAPAGSVITVYVDGTALASTTTANGAGNWAITQPTALAQGSHTVRATAQTSGSAVSANSSTNTFTVDSVRPTVAISSSAGTSGGTTSTSPIPYTVTFSEAVTGFVAGDVIVAGGTISGFAGSGTTYTFNVTPSAAGTVTVNVAANVAQDQAGNGNTAATQYSLTFAAPTIVVAPASLPNGQQGTAYSQALSASGGTAPYTYAITAGALPAGLSLNTSGTIAGTPTTNGTFNFTVTATDASAAPGPYNGSRSYSLVISTQPATAAPVVTTPANNSFSNNRSVTVTGTAPAGSTVSILINGNLAGTTPASGTGAFSFVIPGNAPDGTYVVSATAQSSGATVSPSSNGNTFTIDGTAPTAALSSATVASGGTTSTSPVSFTATFNELVTGLTAAGLTVSNGTVTSGPTAGANNTYTFQVTPSAAGTVTVQIAAGAAQDQATNGNTASAPYSFTFAAPTIAVAPASLPNGQQGVAYSQALSATGGTAPYTYVLTAGVLPTGLSLANGTIVGTPTVNGTFNFTVTATDASVAPGPYSGSQAYTLVIAAPAITATSWTGAVSTDWFTAGNWTQGVPDATIDATIPAAPSGGRFPAIAAGTASVRNLTFNSGATLNQSGGTLAIAANLTNNGTFLPTGGTVSLGSTTLSNVLGSSNIRFWNLTVGANGAQLSTSSGASMQRLLTLNGNFATNGNSFVLESNTTLTALVANNSGVVTGTVTVQRAIDPSVNPGLGYRHYSAPVSNSTVGDLATSGFTPVVNPAYNTDAMPYSVVPFPTVFGYDDSRLSLANNALFFDKGFFSPAALSDPLAVGKGYTVNIGATEVVDFQGDLNNGPLTQSLTSTRNTYPDGGWQFLGNPYPAPLDYSRVAAADRLGLESAIYVYSSTSQYNGRYRVYINGIGNPVLPVAQGFFARVAAGQTTATMTFRNSQRLTVPNATAFQRTTADPRPLVQLTLQGQSAALADEAYVYFENGATSGFDAAFDAEKLPNSTGLNLSTTQAGQQLSIDGQPELGTAQRVVPLAVGVPAAGVYTFTASQLLNLSATPVYLRDRQLGTLTDLRQQPTYQFTVSNAAALNTTRFELVFSPQQALATVPAALAQQVALYPNPAKTQATIELPLSLSRQPVTASLLDALGRVVRTQVLPAGLATHSLPLADLATGVYSLRLTTEAGVIVKKLVVE